MIKMFVMQTCPYCEFVEKLARGEGNFYDGWMKNPMSAMISCNDGFRPFSFYIEVIDE